MVKFNLVNKKKEFNVKTNPKHQISKKLRQVTGSNKRVSGSEINLKTEEGKNHQGPNKKSGVKGSVFQCKNGEKWYEAFREISEMQKVDKLDAANSETSDLDAKALLNEHIQEHSNWFRSQNAQSSWIETVEKNGTFADRLSALQLRVQRFPIYSLGHVNSIINTLNAKGLRESHSLLTVLQQIFIEELIPPNRKLISFGKRPINSIVNKSLKHDNMELVIWAFESELKRMYISFIHALEKLAGNIVEGIAKSACKILVRLLIERSEQEQLLLSNLVNKLGHPNRHVGSLICQLLEELIHKHPNMRLIIVSEVEQLIFRKNVGLKAHRYAVHFLTRVILRAGEFELALKLVKIYLNLFRALTMANRKNVEESEKTGEQQPWSRILPLLLTGLNRAFPYLKGHADDVMAELESLYSIVQTSKLVTSLQVLRLLFQIHSKTEGLPDRFYSSFYRRIAGIDASSSVGHQFFQLIGQVMQHDLVESRARAFMKRLLQLALSGSSSFACASLITISGVVKERPKFLRLRNSSFSNKFPSFSTTASKRSKKNNKNVAKRNEMPDDVTEQKFISEDEEEHYEDIQSDSESKAFAGKSNAFVSGWNWIQPSSSKKINSTVNESVQSSSLKSCSKSATSSYDPTARNPLFAGADLATDEELYILARHYHPSVVKFAQCLISERPIDYDGDPLIDFTTIRFIDRFAFKNPKKANDKKKSAEKNNEEGSDVSDAEFEAIMDKELGAGFKKARLNCEDDDGDDNKVEDEDLGDFSDDEDFDGDEELDNVGSSDDGKECEGSDEFDDEGSNDD